MKTIVYRSITASSLLMAAIIGHAQPLAPTAFSSMEPGGKIRNWHSLKPAPKAPDTHYALVRDEGRTVVRAEAQASMSGLSHPVQVSIRDYPLLRWRWKVAAPVESADMTNKDGDDYAARLYVIFDYPAEKLPLGTRLKLRMAESFHQQKIPTAAINYVWDNRHPVGRIQSNAYTDRARMIVADSGSAKAGKWVTHTRDLVMDFRDAFGEDPPDVIAVAVATDTDNTGELAIAWYGDIEFLPRSAP